MAWYNCAGGLVAKIDNIKLILNLNSFDILFVSKAEIKIESDLSLFNIAGYSLHVAGTFAKVHHVRSVVYVREGLGLSVTTYSDLEIIRVSRLNLEIVGVYRQFKLWPGQTHRGEMDKILKGLYDIHSSSNGKLIVIGGDFNLDWHKRNDPSYHSSPLVHLLEEWSDECSMSQLVKETTRHRTVKLKSGQNRTEESCIDLIFTNNSSRCMAGQSPGFTSDHDIISVSICDTRINKTKFRRKFKLRDWRNYDANLVNFIANDFPITLPPGGSIDEWAQSIENSLRNVTDSVAPLRVVKTNRVNDVINTRIAALTKKRDRAIKLGRKNKNPFLMLKARELSKKLKKVIKRERMRITNAKARTSNPGGFWRLVNSFVGKSRPSEIKIVENEIELSNDAACEKFGNFFDKKVQKLCEGFTDVPVVLQKDNIEVVIS
jgi:hypothetical protein